MDLQEENMISLKNHIDSLNNLKKKKEIEITELESLINKKNIVLNDINSNIEKNKKNLNELLYLIF